MKMKDHLQWIATFGALTLLTINMIGNVTGLSTPKVLAATLNSSPQIVDNLNEDNVILLDSTSSSDKNFIKKFERYYAKNKICVLSKNQYEALSLLYSTSTETLALSTKNVEVVTINDQDGLSTNFLERVIESSGQDIKCDVLEHKNTFYTLFNFDIS